MNPETPLRALSALLKALRALNVPHALVGGLAVSVRAEPRFTRGIDLAVGVEDDRAAEAVSHGVIAEGYSAMGLVEHAGNGRLAIVRLLSPEGLAVQLVTAATGLEREIVGRATPVTLPEAGVVPVATAEDLLVSKVVAFDDVRLQDMLDARALVAWNPGLDLDAVRTRLGRVASLGFAGGQDLGVKLGRVLAYG